MSGPLLATALAFARHGHAVLPLWWPVKRRDRLVCSCRRGADCGRTAAKHPYGPSAPNGLLDASAEPGQIKSWWQRAPEANLGARTDKLVVVDIDPRHNGDESFALLEREHGTMPPTWRVLTGGGGEHIIFTCPDGVKIANVVAENMANPPLGPGIDIRALGGYIVAPPSRHISGRWYRWSVDHHPQDVALAVAPGWLIERLVARSQATIPKGTSAEPHPSDFWARLTGQPVTEYSDDAASKIAGHLLRRWVDPYLVAGLLHARSE